jgi:hypothetical protein
MLDFLWNIYIGEQRPIISNQHSWHVVLANPSLTFKNENPFAIMLAQLKIVIFITIVVLRRPKRSVM